MNSETYIQLSDTSINWGNQYKVFEIFVFLILDHLEKNPNYYNPLDEFLNNKISLKTFIDRLFINKRNISNAIQSLDNKIRLYNIKDIDIALNHIKNNYDFRLLFESFIKQLEFKGHINNIKKEFELTNILVNDFKWQVPKIALDVRNLADNFYQENISSKVVTQYDFVNNFLANILYYDSSFIQEIIGSEKKFHQSANFVYSNLFELHKTKYDTDHMRTISSYQPKFYENSTIKFDKSRGFKLKTVEGQTINFKEFNLTLANQLVSKLHMIHSPGSGEQLLAFGAFLETDSIPYIWAIINQLEEKDYIKSFLNYYNFELHEILEISRSWSHISTPKYHLGIFYSILEKYVKNTKASLGFITTINPNLGFNASAYRGNGFRTVFFRKSGFKYNLSMGEPIVSYLSPNSESLVEGRFDSYPNNVIFKPFNKLNFDNKRVMI